MNKRTQLSIALCVLAALQLMPLLLFGLVALVGLGHVLSPNPNDHRHAVLELILIFTTVVGVASTLTFFWWREPEEWSLVTVGSFMTATAYLAFASPLHHPGFIH